MSYEYKDTRNTPSRAVWAHQLKELLDAVRGNGLDYDPGALEELTEYCEFVSRHNQRAGLVSKRDLEGLVNKHVAASLGPLLLAEPKPNEEWLDFGTGGGFPGLVIKLARPETRMTLLDSSRKKTILLEKFREERQLNDLQVVEAWVGPNDGRELSSAGSATQAKLASCYDVILMRAVKSLRESFPLIEKISGATSRFITFKGAGWEAELKEAREAMNQFQWIFRRQLQIPWAVPKLLFFSRKADNHTDT